MYELKLNLAIALGNGTRRKDEVLALIEDIEPNELLAEAFELVDNDLGKLPGTITPTEGVAPTEVLTALRNPRLCEFVAFGRKPAANVADDESDASEGSAPADKPVSLKKRASRKK